MLKYFLLVFGLSLDFRGVDEGGNLFQLFLFSVTILASFLIVMKPSYTAQTSGLYKITILLLAIHLMGSLVNAILNSVELGRHLRVAVTYFLFFAGSISGLRMVEDIGFQRSIFLILISSLISIVFTVIYGFASTGLDISGIRYQILSPMLFVAIPILASFWCLWKTNAVISKVILVGVLGLIIISSTRSWLIAYIFVVLSAVVLSKYSQASFPVAFFSGIAIWLIIFLGATVAAVTLLPDATSRLAERVFSSRETLVDISSATRLAEIDFQISAWLQSPVTFLFGNGIGATYGFSGEYVELLVKNLGDSGSIDNWWFSGHNFVVYSLFSQGVVFGLVYPLGIIYVLCRLVLKLKTIHSTGSSNQHEFNEIAMLLIFVISLIFSMVGGNPFGDRPLSLFMGILFGIIVFCLQRKTSASSVKTQTA